MKKVFQVAAFAVMALVMMTSAKSFIDPVYIWDGIGNPPNVEDCKVETNFVISTNEELPEYFVLFKGTSEVTVNMVNGENLTIEQYITKYRNELTCLPRHLEIQ